MPLQLLHDYGELYLIAASNDGHWLSIYPDKADFNQQAIFAPATGIRLPLPPLPSKHYRSIHAYTPDNAYLLTVESAPDQDKIVYRSLVEGEAREILSLESPYYRGLLNTLATTSTLLAIPDGKRSGEIGVALYSVPQGERITRIDGGAQIGFLQDLTYLADNTLLLRDALDRVMHLDIATNQSLALLNLPHRVVRTAFASDASIIAVFATNLDPREPDPAATQWLTVQSLPTGTEIFRHDVPRSDFITSLSFSSDNKLLAVAYRERTVCIFDADTGALREQLTLTGPADKYYGYAQFLSDGTLLVRDGFVRVYAIT